MNKLNYRNNKTLCAIKKSLHDFLINTNSIIYILLTAFILRFIWIILVPTSPSSDFALMYNTAKSVSLGDFSSFFGNNYFARFTHDTIPVLYFSMFLKLFTNSLFAIKVINVILSTFSVYMIYKLCSQIYGELLGKLGALILTLFPPFIMYCSETMAENMAIPLFICSLYFFIKYMDKNKLYMLILSGLFLSFGDLFRPVGIIFLIAYILYYIFKQKFHKLYIILILIISMILPIFLISKTLVSNNVIGNQLWNPKESVITSILKGTNMTSLGAWNEEDSMLPAKYNYDKNKINEEAFNIISNRFKNSSPFEILSFYVKKVFMQWGIGDFGSYEWTVTSSPTKGGLIPLLTMLSPLILIYCYIFYICLIVLSIKGIFKLKFQKNKSLLLCYLIFVGFVAFYLITERQARYSFVCCWLLVIFTLNGLITPKAYNK